MFHDSTVHLKDKQKANRSAKPISSKSRVNGIYFCGTLLEVLLMLFTDTAFIYLSCCNGRLSKPCRYQTRLLPTHKSSAWTAGCKRGEKAKSYLLGFSLTLQLRFSKPVLSLQPPGNHAQMFRVSDLTARLGWWQFMSTVQQKWERGPLLGAWILRQNPPALALSNTQFAVPCFHSIIFSGRFFKILGYSSSSLTLGKKWGKASLRTKHQVSQAKHLH